MFSIFIFALRILLFILFLFRTAIDHANPVLGRASHLSCDILSVIVIVVCLPLIFIVFHLLNKLKRILIFKQLSHLLIMLLLERIVVPLSLLKLIPCLC